MPKFLPFSGSGFVLANVVQGVFSIILHRMTVLCCVDKLDRKSFGHCSKRFLCKAKFSLLQFSVYNVSVLQK